MSADKSYLSRQSHICQLTASSKGKAYTTGCLHLGVENHENKQTKCFLTLSVANVNANFFFSTLSVANAIANCSFSTLSVANVIANTCFLTLSVANAIAIYFFPTLSVANVIANTCFSTLSVASAIAIVFNHNRYRFRTASPYLLRSASCLHRP